MYTFYVRSHPELKHKELVSPIPPSSLLVKSLRVLNFG